MSLTQGAKGTELLTGRSKGHISFPEKRTLQYGIFLADALARLDSDADLGTIDRVDIVVHARIRQQVAAELDA